MPQDNPVVSVVVPCLNESLTIAECVRRAKTGFSRAGLPGEVVVADNGSTDNSVAIAVSEGARVVIEAEKGYGSALRRGISEAKGKYIVMGDADDTYDFSELDKFVSKLIDGFDLVMGSRFLGKILPGAMTWSHRYIGNPILSGMLRIFFGGSVSDSHCGLRAFTKSAYNEMNLHTTGMEFASEMVIHALKKRLKIAEIPIIYYVRKGESKLSSLRDAWRHIRFMLMYSPGYLFFLPGFLLFGPSFAALMFFLTGHVFLFGHEWGVHVMVFSAMLALLGWSLIFMGLAAKSFTFSIGLEEDEFSRGVLKLLTLERMLLLGSVFFIFGVCVAVYIVIVWAKGNFGELAQVEAAIFALTLLVMGLQTAFSAFLSSMFNIKYR